MHRFTWLLRWLAQAPSGADFCEADGAILDWIEHVAPAENPLAWNAYSVSERVVNWLLYLCATRKHRRVDSQLAGTIGASLCGHLTYIMEHMEYYGESYNNHILNNARALYLGGRMLHLQQAADLARVLFRECVPRLIDNEGCLLEGSSHYQLLLTRTMIETLWAARVSEDTAFAGWLEDIATSMTSSCLYLGSGLDSLEDTFPRIGDVSPDYPVSWFYPDSEYGRDTVSWRRLWDDSTTESLLKKQAGRTKVSGTLTEWRWISTPGAAFRALVHTPQSGLYPVAHGHLDFGSFQLHDGEKSVLVDRGRISYRSDSQGMYGFSPKAHNTTLINGLPLVPDCRGLFSAYSEYLSNGTGLSIHEKNGQKTISWETNAVERIGTGMKWERNLTMEPARIESLESVSNPCGVRIRCESYIHWAPEWKILDNIGERSRCFLIGKEGRTYQLEIDLTSNVDSTVEWFLGEANSPEGWQFAEYGLRIPALTIRLSILSTRDCSARFVLIPA